MYIWHLLRHGTRYPSSKEIKKLLDPDSGVPALIQRLRDKQGRVGASCNETVNRLLSWTLGVTPDEGNALHERGKQDLLGIGARLRLRHPTFFENSPNATSFTVRRGPAMPFSSCRFQNTFYF